MKYTLSGPKAFVLLNTWKKNLKKSTYLPTEATEDLHKMAESLNAFNFIPPNPQTQQIK